MALIKVIETKFNTKYVTFAKIAAVANIIIRFYARMKKYEMALDLKVLISNTK